MIKGIMFCDAVSDCRATVKLIDDVLALRCADWVRVLLEHSPEGARTWCATSTAAARGWFDLHTVYSTAEQLGVTPRYGHFGGNPAQPGALMVATIFAIARRLNQTVHASEPINALVVVWDMDGQAQARRAGLAQGRANGGIPRGVRVVLGAPNLEMEAWVLLGFTPQSERERDALAAARSELGFSPVAEPHRLDATSNDARKNPKRVLEDVLGVATWARREECLRIPSDEVYSARCAADPECGLGDFLHQVADELAPLVDPSAPTSPH